MKPVQVLLRRSASWRSQPTAIPRSLSGRLAHFALAVVLACPAASLRAEDPVPPKAPGDSKEQPPQEARSQDPVAAAKDRLPQLPKGQLPPQTRKKPDPAKDAYRLSPVYVWVEETVTPQNGEDYAPKDRVTENYLKAYFQRAGYPVVSDAKDAAFRLEGSAKLRFHSQITAFQRSVGWKYRAEAVFRAFDASGNEVERFDVPELFQENVKSEDSTVVNIRRYLSKITWENLAYHGKTFGNARVTELVNSLAIADSPEAVATGKEPRSAEDIVRELADIGFPAVPYLLDAMSDERAVQKASSYPGIQGRCPEELRIYHIADKALEEIFQKVSRLNLDSARQDRVVVLRGWEAEWKRFCPSFAALEGYGPRSRAAAPKTGADAPAGAGAPDAPATDPKAP